MNETKVWLTTHMGTVILISVTCMLSGILLLIIGWLLRLYVKNNGISAKKGGVAVGRDNYGTIITGVIGAEKTPRKADSLAVIANWVNIIGLSLALVAIVISILAWQFPVLS